MENFGKYQNLKQVVIISKNSSLKDLDFYCIPIFEHKKAITNISRYSFFEIIVIF